MAGDDGFFCSASGISAKLPECRHIVDYLDALAEGASSNRGSGRSGAVKGAAHALRLIAHKLGLDGFATILRGPVVSAWLAAQK